MKDEPHDDRRTIVSFKAKGPFASDPRGVEAWLWAALPLVLFGLLAGGALYAPDWYLSRLQPEGYGLQELSHFFIPAAAAVVTLLSLRHKWVWTEPTLLAWIVLLALGCFYIAGEEHSWGQHFFNWHTPDYWRALNAQNETNLHNMSDLFGKLPRTFLTAGIVVLGVVYPLCALLWPGLRDRNPIAICMPPLCLLPTALCVIVITSADYFGAMSRLGQPGVRLSEMSETFIYLFLLLGAVVLRRRVMQIGAIDPEEPCGR